MDWIFITAGIILILAGILGAVIPGLPGPPLSFLALVMLQFTQKPPFTENFLIIMGLIMAAVTLLDYYIPIYGTKKFGGSKQGIRGSTIGLIIGVFILPLLGIVIGPFGLLGIILGPFAGAYVGELMAGKNPETALRSAVGSFIGFLAGTLMKVAYSIVAGVYFFIGLF
jgi:hypothetical protein